MQNKKPVQIISKGYGYDLRIVALCDDGSIYEGRHLPENQDIKQPWMWTKVPPIPCDTKRTIT